MTNFQKVGTFVKSAERGDMSLKAETFRGWGRDFLENNSHGEDFHPGEELGSSVRVSRIPGLLLGRWDRLQFLMDLWLRGGVARSVRGRCGHLSSLTPSHRAKSLIIICSLSHLPSSTCGFGVFWWHYSVPPGKHLTSHGSFRPGRPLLPL